MERCRVENKDCPIAPDKCCCGCEKIDECKKRNNLCGYVRRNMKFECAQKII